MAVNDKANVDVEVNGQGAGQVLDQLEKKAKAYRDAMTQANKANDLVGYQKAQAELKKTESSMTKLKNASFEVNNVLKNLSGSTLKDLQRAKSAITKELEKMTRGTKEYTAASKNLRAVSSEIGKVKVEMQGVAGAQESWFSRASSGFNKYFGMLTAGVAAFTGVIFGVRKAIDSYNEFEKTVSNLSALTGLQGENLKWLADQAKLLSTSTTEAGVKITASATEIVDAYRLMGSAKPELLKNKEALNEVTKAALILAEASSMEAGEAVTSLANIMNQFSAPAEDAGKFINILAAGSKEGAAEVNDLSDSIVRSGAAATQANISIEQEVALIETLAEKGIKAERAGTGLRGTILKLQKGADEFNPKIVGMSKALENLAAKNLSAKQVMELFGEESYTVAQTLITSRKRFDDLTAAITNTNVATEQAVINTSNNSAKLEQAKNKAGLTAITLGEKLAPALTFSTNGFSYLMKVMLAIIKIFEEHGRLILSATIGIIAYTAALKAQEVWTWAVEKATKAAEIAMSLFNKASKANWLAIIIGLLATAVSAFLFFKKEVEAATQAQNEFNDAVKRGNEILAGNKSVEERYKILSTLSKRQLIQLKDDIKNQLLAEEDYTSKLLALLQKRYDEDQKLAELSDVAKRQKNLPFLQAWTLRQIEIRKDEISKDLQLEQNKHDKSKKMFGKYLSDIDALLKTMPDNADPLSGPTDEEVKKMLQKIDEAYQKRRMRIMQQRANDKITDEQYQAKLLAEEIAYLNIKYEALKDAGQSTVEVQQQIAEKQIQLLNKITEAQNKANKEKEKSDKEYFDGEMERLKAEEEAIWDKVLEQEKADEYAHQQKAQYYENLKGITDNLATSLGDTFGNLAANAEMTSKDFAKAMVLIALDGLHAVVRMAIAEIWAKQIASKGFSGIGTSLALSALVEAAFAGAKAVASNSFKNSDSSGKTKHTQHFAGTIDAVGADDGRTYQAGYVGSVNAPTYFPNTSLISERGGELVVDSARSRNIRMRYPQLLEAIRAVPQHASGTIGGSSSTVAGAPSTTDPMLALNIRQNTAMLAALYGEIRKGIVANMNYDHFKDRLAKGDNAIDDVSR